MGKEKSTTPQDIGNLSKNVDQFLKKVQMYNNTEAKASEIQVFVPDGMGSDRVFQDDNELEFAKNNPEVDRLFQSIKNDARKIK